MNHRHDLVLPGWLAAVLCAVAFGGALTSALAQQPDPAGAPVASAAPESDVPHGADHGLYPLFQDAAVPGKWMPPGSDATPTPSEEVYPPQTIAIRFNHQWHVKKMKQTCRACHGGVYDSDSAKERQVPNPQTTCDNCHDVNHANLTEVKAGTDPNGQCSYCHLGEDAGKGGVVAKSVWPEPNLRFPHKKHLARNIDCGQCHGSVEELELATREQLPRMAGCFTCHAMSGASAGDARGDCTVCHITEPSGLLRTSFSTGKLKPPHWLHGADHGPDWIERHKPVAAANSAMCGSCHSNEFCTDCHDSKIRPRQVHPNDWISMHAEGAKLDNPRCVSCHQLQSFCGDCHRRVGVARDAPSGNRQTGRRFHPPPEEWSSRSRGARHHALEAQRNLNACVSCHSERDCTTCHASRGVRGGAGIDPHPPGFATSCFGPLHRNPRPCLVCHEVNSSALNSCK